MQIHFAETSKNILNIKADKRSECMNFGIANSYPSIIENLCEISVSMNFCTSKVAKAIYGKSWGTIGKTVVNEDGQSMNDLLRIASREYAKHSNIYFHIGYSIELKIKSIKVLPNTDVRKGKIDSNKYSGKYLVHSNWDKSNGKFDVSAIQKIDAYSPNKEVIRAQIEASKGLSTWKGQILHIQKDSNKIYSLSDLNPVLSEGLLESNSQLFRSRGASDGFIGSKMVVIQPFNSPEERNAFTKTIQNQKGVDKSDTILVLESSHASDDLSKQYDIKDISSPPKFDMFEYSDKMARANIALSMEVPAILLDSSNTSLFGNSGELLKQARIELFENREEERDLLEETFAKLLENSVFDVPTVNLQIINPYASK